MLLETPTLSRRSWPVDEVLPGIRIETPAPSRPARSVNEVIRRYGGPVSTALLDPACSRFSAPGIDGMIGYKVGLGCAVGIGDPVCAPADMPALAGAFRDFCRENGWHTAYAVAGQAFTEWGIRKGYAAIEFGEELILDPKRDPQQGSSGRELRKKVQRARRDGAAVLEYRPGRSGRSDLEAAMDRVATNWLEARRGPQIYLAHVDLFSAPEGKRWFYALHRERVVGVLSMMSLEARGGYLLDHLMAAPDAPTGTTEMLVVEGLKAIGAEGCGFATFGPAPANQLGKVTGLPPLSESLARLVFSTSGKLFHLDTKARYREKFQVARREPSSMLFDPPQIGLREVYGMLRAFNVSIWL